MNKTQQRRFDSLYQSHLSALSRQGKSAATIDAYGRAVRRVAGHFDTCPDRLSAEQLKAYFAALVQSHSWSTVKIDRNGLQFFYKHVLGKQWQWLDIVKPPQVRTLPDILTADEVSKLLASAREARYQCYILTVYSMGLRLGEALRLEVGDIDAARMQVHVRCGKGRRDRFVTLPERTLETLRRYWATHRHPTLLFPAGHSAEQRRRARAPMDRGGVQKSFQAIVRECGIRKRVTIHTLRHCYGAHLVEAGLNLRAIQHQLGHTSPTTTALYTQLTEPAQQDAARLINTLVERLSFSLEGQPS